jgi:hypothetical protein
MLPCARFAYFTLTRDASFVALAAVLLMVAAAGFELPLAFKIGATVALLFCLLLLARSCFMTEERFLRSEAWRSLRPDERPTGESGPRIAHAECRELMLRFAKNAAAVSGVLYISALVLAAANGPGHDTIVTAGFAADALK